MVIIHMNKAHRKTLNDIFSQPVPATLEWRRIESLFISLGAETIEAAGSRVRFVLNGIIAAFHRPHPAKEAIGGSGDRTNKMNANCIRRTA